MTLTRQAAAALPIARPARHAKLGVMAFLLLTGAAAGLLAVFHPEIPAIPPLHFAMVMPLSGPDAEVGKNMVKAAQLYFDEVNREGGVEGRRLVMDAVDDEGKPEVAERRAQEAVKGPTIAVVGHYQSSTAMRAGPVYKAAHLPALTATANADGLTLGNPYYFRVTFDTSAQGQALATYTHEVLKQNRASILYTDEDFGRSLNASFRGEYTGRDGKVAFQWKWDPKGTPEEHAALMDQVAENVAYDDAGVVVLAMSPNSAAREAVLLLRRHGADPILLGGSALDSRFAEFFKEEPEEKQEPGFFTRNLYAAATIIYDSANDRGVSFHDKYAERYKEEPSARAAKYYEVAMLLTEAVRRAGLELTPASRDRDRERLREWLAGRTNPAEALEGPTCQIYFGEDRTVPQPVRMGRCVERRFLSAPVQLEVVPNPALIDLDRELAEGGVMRMGQKFYFTQRVVYTGIDVNRIGRVDATRGTFTADFYLWFRYTGNDDVLDIDLNAATEKSPYDPKHPLEAKMVNGLKYRLYRVQGEFKSTFDFYDYPFDHQALRVRLMNPHLTREQAIYAIDTLGLRLPRADKGISELRPLANWDFTAVRYLPDTLRSSSTRGDPGAFHGQYESEYSGFDTVVGIERKTLVFLIKSLLPLILLVMVVYVTLHFPVSLTKERLTIAISAMLASAVLLSAINTQLTDVGYTTAIEYGFYGFFAMCLFCVVTALTVERLHMAKAHGSAETFNLLARVIYILSVVGMFAAYGLRYSR